MAHDTPSTSARSTVRPSRRSIIGLLAAVPLAGAGILVASEDADAKADADARPDGSGIPKDLRPGGAYDRLITRLAAEDRFSGTVLLARRGRPVLARSHGMADRVRAIRNGPDTVFGLASISKPFTGLAIAGLAHQGKVAFQATVGAYLDGFPAEIADHVTIHQLLTHTSGVGRPPLGSGGPPADWDSFDKVLEGTLAAVRTTPLRFAPGTRYEYTNDEYWVLGAIVAKVSGMSYVDHIRRHVFEPAGMTRAAFHGKPDLPSVADLAHPYWTQPSGPRVDASTSPFFPYTNGPAGGAYATAPDLLRFARALTAGRLLSPAFTDLVTTGKVALTPAQRPGPPTQDRFYAYGFEDLMVNGQRIYGHSGGGPGMANQLDVFPDLDWVSIVLGNYDDRIDPIVELGRKLITA
ncbi:beta-lactamase family protein (plasmid) [Embleya sp. NBC_00888]|uniref:serine hydrolase domain-containing protein n=1 Tax=Embleya sp. NBC_00888 TaxID=2975960 RepID=UPI002F912B49|nr:beta-lactamase family protein [Embleya sp. NBC_00888]